MMDLGITYWTPLAKGSPANRIMVCVCRSRDRGVASGACYVMATADDGTWVFE